MKYIERAPLAGLDILRMNSIRWTQYFQQGLGMRSSSTEYMRWMSFMMDSNMMYFWVYPICSLIQPVLGLRLLFALLTTDWIVHILKCIFPDDRPYWWFPLTEYSKGGASATTMYEFPETCQEVTGGFPSVHSAQFVAVSFVILSHLQSGLRNISKSWIVALKVLTIGIFVVLNLIGIIARILLATSFHYQLFCGVIIGIIVGKLACSTSLYKLYLNTPKAAIYYCWAIYGSVFWICILLYYKEEDPFWTVPLALKWCWSLSYVYKSLKRNLLFYTLRILGTSTALLSICYFGIRLPVEVINWKGTAILVVLDAVEVGTMYFVWREMERWTIPQYLFTSLLIHIGHTVLISTICPIIANRLTSTSSYHGRSKDKYTAFRTKFSHYVPLPS